MLSSSWPAQNQLIVLFCLFLFWVLGLGGGVLVCLNPASFCFALVFFELLVSYLSVLMFICMGDFCIHFCFLRTHIFFILRERKRT